MKKVNVTIVYDEERLCALRLFLAQKNLSVEDQLLSSLDALFRKTVPPEVRKFFALKSGETDTADKKESVSARAKEPAVTSASDVST